MSLRVLLRLLFVALVAYAAGLFLPNPLRDLGFGSRVPVVRVPAVTGDAFTIRWIDGVDATLTRSGLPAARFPQGWLPQGTGIGSRVRISTEIRLEGTASEFWIRLEAQPDPTDIDP